MASYVYLVISKLIFDVECIQNDGSHVIYPPLSSFMLMSGVEPGVFGLSTFSFESR